MSSGRRRGSAWSDSIRGRARWNPPVPEAVRPAVAAHVHPHVHPTPTHVWSTSGPRPPVFARTPPSTPPHAPVRVCAGAYTGHPDTPGRTGVRRADQGKWASTPEVCICQSHVSPGSRRAGSRDRSPGPVGKRTSARPRTAARMPVRISARTRVPMSAQICARVRVRDRARARVRGRVRTCVRIRLSVRTPIAARAPARARTAARRATAAGTPSGCAAAPASCAS